MKFLSRSVMAAVLAALFISGPVIAQQSSTTPPPTPPSPPQNEVTVARAQLSRMIELLNALALTVERPDLGRTYFLRDKVKKVDDTIVARGLANMGTLNEYQNLIVGFRYSSNFFTRVQTQSNAQDIAEINAIETQIVEDRGFDDRPYSQIIASTFTQMHKLFEDLLALPIDDRLKDSLRAILPDLGNAIAIAQQGDRPRAFAAGEVVYHQVVALYPDFQRIGGSDVAFNAVLQIQGLNEFFGEYAQVEN